MVATVKASNISRFITYDPPLTCPAVKSNLLQMDPGDVHLTGDALSGLHLRKAVGYHGLVVKIPLIKQLQQ